MSTPTKYLLAESNSLDPYFNLSLEKYLFDNVHGDEVILYIWQNDLTVVCGRNQNVYKECNVTSLEQHGGKIAKRLSGGGAVYHDAGNLNFTFVAKDHLFDTEKQLSVILKSCEKLGIHAVQSGRNDLLVDDKKFSGSAFYSSHGSKLHHGTIMIDVNIDNLSTFLNVSHDKLKSKGVDSVKSRVVNLRDIKSDITAEAMGAAIVETFKEIYNVTTFAETLSLGGQSVLSGTGKGGWTSASSMISMLQGIAENQKLFSSEDWIFGKKFEFTNTIEKRFPWGDIELGLEVKGDKITAARVFSDSLFPDFMSKLEKKLPGNPYTYDGICAALEKTTSAFKEDTSHLANDLKDLVRNSI